MISIKHYNGSTAKKSIRPALEIRFHFVDGSRESFIQCNSAGAEIIRHQMNLSSLFHQPRIVVADDYSKSVFVCSHLNRIDLVYQGADFSKIPPDHVELVELTEAEFHQSVPVNDPTRLQKRKQVRKVGDLMVSFLDLRMRGGSNVYLMKETPVKIPAENHSFMQRLLSKGVYGIRLAEGGVGFLNLENLIGYTVYPGVPEVPVDTLMAERATTDSESTCDLQDIPVDSDLFIR